MSTATADYTDTQRVEDRLKNSAKKIENMSGKVALAKQILDFMSERKRMCLAEFTAPLLATHSAAAAETLARTCPEYKAALAQLEHQYQHAEATLGEYRGAQAMFDAARSLLSFERESLRQLEG